MRPFGHLRKLPPVHIWNPVHPTSFSDSLVGQLNAVISTVMKQKGKLDTQEELFTRLLDANANTTIGNNSTLAPVQSDVELTLNPQYWNALGTTFVDVVRTWRHVYRGTIEVCVNCCCCLRYNLTYLASMVDDGNVG